MTVNEPKSHHFYAQFLLNRWSDENNKIWCFDKAKCKILHKGTRSFGCKDFLYKSENMNLETGLMSRLDNFHGRFFDQVILNSLYGKRKRIPKVCLDFMANLCLWTALRHKTYVEEEGEDWLNLLEELSNLDRLSIEFKYCFLCHSPKNKFITSNLPVQEVDHFEVFNGVIESMTGMVRFYDVPNIIPDTDLILFAITPYLLFVISNCESHKRFDKQLVEDQFFEMLNYYCHANSKADQIYFPYKIYKSDELEEMPHWQKMKNCAVDISQLTYPIRIWGSKKLFVNQINTDSCYSAI